MGYIYKITNTKTGKMYVGQTTTTIQQRWEEHLKMARNKGKNYALYRAMRKDGINNFYIEELEKCDNETLGQREVYWIKLLKTFENGYNMKRGGLVGRTKTPSQEQIEKWWLDYKNGKSVFEISSTSSFGRTTIMKYLKTKEGYKELSYMYLCHKNNAQNCSKWKSVENNY